MPEKILNSRIVHKHDIEANWIKAANFVPKQAEIIIYDKDASHDYQRLKIGDGVTRVNELPFVNPFLKLITGYDESKVQILSHDSNGNVAWINSIGTLLI